MEAIAGNFYGLPGMGMNRVDNSEVINGGYLLFIRGYARFVSGFVGVLLIPNRN